MKKIEKYDVQWMYIINFKRIFYGNCFISFDFKQFLYEVSKQLIKRKTVKNKIIQQI